MNDRRTSSMGRRQDGRGPLERWALPGHHDAARAPSTFAIRPFDLLENEDRPRRTRELGREASGDFQRGRVPQGGVPKQSKSDLSAPGTKPQYLSSEQAGGIDNDPTDALLFRVDQDRIAACRRIADAAFSPPSDPPSRPAVTRRAIIDRGRDLGESLDGGAASHHRHRSPGLAAQPSAPEPSPTFRAAGSGDLPASHTPSTTPTSRTVATPSSPHPAGHDTPAGHSLARRDTSGTASFFCPSSLVIESSSPLQSTTTEETK